MNILALDTSAVTATAAIAVDGYIAAEESVTTALTHSQTLMPMIDTLLKKVSLSINDIDLFACSTGPGSFTGLRIGVGTVKGLAFGTGKKVCAVSSLEALAYNVPFSNRLVSPIMDARRGQVYNAVYKFTDGALTEKESPRALSLDELCSSFTEKVIFVGDGVKPYREKITSIMGERALFAPPQHIYQSAASVAYAALFKEAQDPIELEVTYLRKPQAERERELKVTEKGE